MIENGEFMSNMTASEVIELFSSCEDEDKNRTADQVWCVSCFGPVVSHEIKLVRTFREAIAELKQMIGKSDEWFDEMCSLCVKDTNGNEFEMRLVKIP